MKALHNGKDNGLTLIHFSVTTLNFPEIPFEELQHYFAQFVVH